MRKIIILFAITFSAILCGIRLQAQATFYNNGGLVHLNQNAVMHVDAQIENKTTSTLENDGVIEVTSHFTNDSTALFTTGTNASSTERAFKFIGPGVQYIYGNVSDTVNRYFYNLVIDKSASGTAVQLGINAAIKGSLVFGSASSGSSTYTPTAASTLTNNSGKGIIKTYDTLSNDHELYVANPAINAISGYGSLYLNNPTADSFIQTRGAEGIGIGGLSRNVSSTAAAYIFPVGTSRNGYNPSAFTFTALGTAMGKVRGMFVDAPGGVGVLGEYCKGCGAYTPATQGFYYYFTSDPCNAGQPQWVSLNELPNNHGYWSFAGDSTDKYTMVTYPYYPSFAGRTIDTWRMLKKSGSITAVPTGDWTPDIMATITDTSDLLTYTRNAGCYTGQGVIGGTYTGFANYQMAREDPGAGTALPVQLISLSAEGIDDQFIRVIWATAQEINNKGYMVQRSTDGSDFVSLGWVPAQGGGNTTTQSDYYYDDMTAVPGLVYYYRLAQIDNDGVTTETYIVQASLTANGSLSISSCFPNPTTDNTKITIVSSGPLTLHAEIYDMAGQLIRRSEVEVAAGETTMNINTSALAAGLYNIVLRSNENVFTNKLNVIK